MNYKDYEYKQFMQNIADGQCTVLDVILREWVDTTTLTTLKSTNGEERYDKYENETEYLYQVKIVVNEKNFPLSITKLIDFDDNEDQAEKVYEELLKRRLTK